PRRDPGQRPEHGGRRVRVRRGRGALHARRGRAHQRRGVMSTALPSFYPRSVRALRWALRFAGSLPRRLARWLSRPGPGQLAAVTVLFLALSAEEIRHTADAASAAVVVFSRVLRRREEADASDGDDFPGDVVPPDLLAGPSLRPLDVAGDCRRSVSRARALAPDRVAVAKRMHRVPALSYNTAP